MRIKKFKTTYKINKFKVALLFIFLLFFFSIIAYFKISFSSRSFVMRYHRVERSSPIPFEFIAIVVTSAFTTVLGVFKHKEWFYEPTVELDSTNRGEDHLK